ncbi:unnamed protein product [Arctia plantaginis]|uniref:Flavin-containing monooxygenase n=1 Tax=Arctia plantaginis TaxID=874455 RepID=A0A8S1AH09_ARCPL|nr:unnamed protein product [Arctia plantaginis]
MGYRPSIIFVLGVFINYFYVTDVLAKLTPTSRVCIIGAGYAGLAAARHMKNNGLNFTVFESTSYIGGTWRFDSRTGTDEFGVPLFTNQYKKLRINTPYQTMEFGGFPFPDGTVSFPSGVCFYKYLQAFARHFDLMKDIQLNSQVTWVQWTGEDWNLTYTKSDTKNNVTEQCDFVVVASGEFNNPYIPKFKGQELFKGKVLHSHSYKDAEDYRSKRVLLIGGRATGVDLAVQLSNITSKLVHSNHIFRTFKTFNPPNFPETYINKPDLKHFTPNGAVFEDDTAEDFDIVIYCTGYKYYHPFLNHLSSGITTSESYVFPLYQQIVNINQPTMTFVGVSKEIISKILEVQAEYSAALAAGKFELPPKDEMLRQWVDHVHTLRKEGFRATDVNSIGTNIDKYFATLHKEAGIQMLPPVFNMMISFDIKNILEDLVNFRDYDYKVISDTQYVKKYNPRQEVCPFNT